MNPKTVCCFRRSWSEITTHARVRISPVKWVSVVVFTHVNDLIIGIINPSFHLPDPKTWRNWRFQHVGNPKNPTNIFSKKCEICSWTVRASLAVWYIVQMLSAGRRQSYKNRKWGCVWIDVPYRLYSRRSPWVHLEKRRKFISHEIHSFIHSSLALQALAGPWPLLQFLNQFCTDGRTPWTWDQSVAGRYLHTGKRTHRHPCLEWDSNPRSQRSSERRQFMS
jgi:hypothetical protein